MKYYIGVDNGKQGAIVVINSDNNIVEKIKMPMNGKFYNMIAIVDFLKRWEPQMVVLEKTQPNSNPGASMEAGRCLGMLQGICSALSHPTTVVPARTWQKEIFNGMGVKKGRKEKKEASAQVVQRTWPREDWVMGKTERAYKVHDGLTDAACLALYGKMKYG
jgi:hypothetical protein